MRFYYRYNDEVMQKLQEMEQDLKPADELLRDAETKVMGIGEILRQQSDLKLY